MPLILNNKNAGFNLKLELELKLKQYVFARACSVLKVNCVVESNKPSLPLHLDDTHFTSKQMANEDDNWNFVHTTN